MALKRRQKKKEKEGVKAEQAAFEREQERMRATQREQQERDIFATTEGEGIQEAANISLGFDDEEDELDEFFRSGTGLLV
jgi:hypothetical protein